MIYLLIVRMHLREQLGVGRRMKETGISWYLARTIVIVLCGNAKELCFQRRRPDRSKKFHPYLAFKEAQGLGRLKVDSIRWCEGQIQCTFSVSICKETIADFLDGNNFQIVKLVGGYPLHIRPRHGIRRCGSVPEGSRNHSQAPQKAEF